MSWSLLPSPTSQALFLVIAIFAFGLPLFGQSALPILAGLFLVSSVINFWVSVGSISHLTAIITTFGLTLLIGLLAQKIVQPTEQLTARHWLNWLLLSYFLAQIVSLVEFYPVPFFDQSLLAVIVFYALWVIVVGPVADQRRSLVNHFIFVGLAVIVVLGSIIWANFPYLGIF